MTTDNGYIALTPGAARRMIDAVHCPECGAAAKFTAVKQYAGSYYVAPAYCCDTEGCDFNLEGPSTWTLALNS